jgi:hypothetical protein
MKICGLIGFVLMFSVTSLWAQSDLAPDKQWIESVDGGFAIPTSPNVSQSFNWGYGGDILVGYRFDKDFSLSLDSGDYVYNLKNPATGTTTSFSYVPLLVVARYNLIEGSVHPYVFFGTGVAINTTSVSPSAGVKYSSSETDFLMAPGIGILVRVADGAGLFIQTRIDLDFIPMGGMIPSDSPAIFVPVQAGLSFFVL